MQQNRIRSVLVAGLHTGENQFIRYCEDLWLKTEHLEEIISTKAIPTKHDAAIIVTNVASHSMFHHVKEAYRGKPVFIARSGVSGIRESFENEVFGGSDVLRKLREIPTEHPRNSNSVLPISIRFWWVLGNFIRIGETVKHKDLVRFFEKFLLKGQEKAIGNAWHKGRNAAYLLSDCIEFEPKS